jgi:hypothetical protein
MSAPRPPPLSRPPALPTAATAATVAAPRVSTTAATAVSVAPTSSRAPGVQPSAAPAARAPATAIAAVPASATPTVAAQPSVASRFADVPAAPAWMMQQPHRGLTAAAAAATAAATPVTGRKLRPLGELPLPVQEQALVDDLVRHARGRGTEAAAGLTTVRAAAVRPGGSAGPIRAAEWRRGAGCDQL